MKETPKKRVLVQYKKLNGTPLHVVAKAFIKNKIPVKFMWGKN